MKAYQTQQNHNYASNLKRIRVRYCFSGTGGGEISGDLLIL